MIWADPSQPAEARAQALVDAVEGRKDLKRLGKWLDDDGDMALRQALVDRAARLGVELDDDAVTWPGKRLLRRALAREPEARERKNPIRRDEAFTCMYCKRDVPPHGRTARDHCPFCLRSRHVDGDVPGDRASECGGRMDPVELVVRDRELTLRYACTRCRSERWMRAVLDGEVPDDWEALVQLSSGVLG